MKRALAMMMTLCMLLSLCACGSALTGTGTGAETGAKADTYAKVTFSDGTSETFEVGEIPAMIRENQYAYNNKYAGNQIEVVTTVQTLKATMEWQALSPLISRVVGTAT